MPNNNTYNTFDWFDAYLPPSSDYALSSNFIDIDVEANSNSFSDTSVEIEVDGNTISTSNNSEDPPEVQTSTIYPHWEAWEISAPSFETIYINMSALEVKPERKWKYKELK